MTGAKKDAPEQARILGAVLEAAFAAILVADKRGRILYCNGAARGLLGVAEGEEVPLEDWPGEFGLLLPDKKTRFPIDLLPLYRALRGETVDRAEVFIRNAKTGAKGWFEARAQPLLDESGATLGAAVSFLPVSKDRAEREAQAKLASLVASSDDAIVGTTADGVVETWNDGARKIYGYSAAEMIGNPAAVLFPPDTADQERALLEKLKRGEAVDHYETRRLTKSGAAIEVSLSASAVKDHQGRVIGIASIARDVTSEKIAQKALRLSQERFAVLVQAVSDYAIYMLDPDGVVSSWNSGAERIKGWKAEEIIGRHFSVFYPAEDAAAGKPGRELELAAIEGRVEDEGWRVRKNGERFWANVVVTALRDEEGALMGFAKVTRDMTERKKADEALRKKSEDLARANAELELFTAVASHELQEPLRKIVAFGDLLKARRAAQLDEGLRADLERIQKAAGHMSRLVEGLRDLTQVGAWAVRTGPVDLGWLLSELAGEMKEEISAASGLIEVGPMPGVRGNPTQLRELFRNLLSNALKFRKPGQPARVRVSSRDAGGGLVEISVKDEGIGFEQRYEHEIFKPFKRLHSEAAYPGVGIGLALCRRIATRHGGAIGAKSEPAAGAAFFVTLPVLHSRPPQ